LDYELSFIKLKCGVNFRDPGDGAETNQPGQLTHGRIETNVDFDTYCFSGRSNELATIHLYATNLQGWPHTRLYSPTGTLLTNDTLTDRPHAFVQDVRLPRDGMYTLVVRSEGPRGTFDYDFCIVTVPSTGSILKPGEPQSGSIALGELDAYRFDVICGESVTLTVETTGGPGEPYIWLYGPAPSVLRSGFGIITQPNLAAGTHTVVVRDSRLNEPFDYKISLLKTPVDRPPLGQRPYLAILRCSGNTSVRWDTNSLGFILEWSPECSNQPDLWSPVTAQPYVIANHFYLNEPATNMRRFYRLHCTNCPSGP
jgi:hypothetical protein